MTAVKHAEEGRALIVRLVNLAARPVVESLRPGLPVLTAEKTDLHEREPQPDRDPVAVADGGRRVRVPLAV